jgi:PAS domain S-box-containing protein
VARKYDRYELEIIISLGFLILFLISLNFISGYSFIKAIRGQSAQFENSANVVANLVRAELEGDMDNWRPSHELLLERLRDLTMLTGIENLVVTDTSGIIMGRVGSPVADDSSGDLLVMRRPLKSRDGRTIATLTVSTANAMGNTLNRLSRWDAVFRAAGLIGALVVAAYFIRAVLYPYRRIKKEALDYNLDLREDGSEHGIEYVVKTFKDIIEELEEKRARLESRYQDSEKRADSLARYNEYILGSINSGVVICDSDGIVTRFNPSAENILKYFEDECRGKHYRQIFGHDHRLTDMLDDALIRGIIHSRLEFEIKRPDGERLWLGCSSSTINDEKGEEMGAVLLMIDLTEIRRLQELDSYTEKMASLGELSAGFAHEIRNSFAAILGFSNLVNKRSKLDNKLKKLIESIRKESMAAESLLSRFLNFARPLDFHPEPTDIATLVNSTLGRLSHPNLEKVKVERRLSPDIPVVAADPVLLEQALSNLLINACDAMPDGGSLIIELETEKKKSSGKPAEIVIAVADSGAGINVVSLEKIFEPFFTNKAGGIGLGLALVKKIVVLHEGRIEVKSKPGKGTRFVLYIPFTAAESVVRRRKSEVTQKL